MGLREGVIRDRRVGGAFKRNLSNEALKKINRRGNGPG